MYQRADIAYRYDGSFDGLMCCVFESFCRKERPAVCQAAGREQSCLYPVIEVDTNLSKAGRVKASIPLKIGVTAWDLITRAFLFDSPEKEDPIITFLHMGYELGYKTPFLLGDETVAIVRKMAQAVEHEAHQLNGFVRFSQHGAALVSVIEPKHFVLPLLQLHFCSRYCEESFFIYDKAHGAALLYKPYQADIIPIDSFEEADSDEEEMRYRQLWSGYYRTISIKERESKKRSRRRMPERFCRGMTELLTIQNREAEKEKIKIQPSSEERLKTGLISLLKP